MYVIDIQVGCPARRAEVDLDAGESAEFAIEDCVSRALLELLGQLVVVEVRIHHAPPARGQGGDVPGQWM